MDEFQTNGLGTTWTILLDGEVFSANEKQALSQEMIRFEATYSRFKPASKLSQINRSSRPKIKISTELVEMLEFGLQLKDLSQGLFDPNVASWETAYGYDQHLQFKPVEEVELPVKGSFTIDDHYLYKQGDVQLDLGAFGKGFLIDKLAELLQQQGHQYFLVDGGRDFWGSTKADGSAWEIGLEHPTDRELAIGIAQLKNQGFAASNSFHRRVGKFHHLLNGQTGLPAQELASVFVLAPTAMMADGISTTMFVSPPDVWNTLSQQFSFDYVTVTQDLQIQMNATFPGEIFEK